MSRSCKLLGFFEELVSACPVLPHMALGIALSWAFIACSGTAWLSDTEVDGANITVFFINVSVAAGIILLIASRFPMRTTELLARPLFVIGGSAIASLGCAVVIVIGPYYLYRYMAETLVMLLFHLGGILSGIGIATVYLKCAELYGMLPPRRAIFYVSLAHIVVAVTYFIIIGSPDWAPVAGGPSFMGIAAFVLMPLLAGCLASIQPAKKDRAWADGRDVSPTIKGRALEGAFWKLVAVVIVFAIVMTAVRAAVVYTAPVDATFNNTRLVMLLRMVIATAFVCAAIAAKGDVFHFGKLFSIVMVFGVIVLGVLPTVGVLHVIGTQAMSVIGILFEFILWCILSFIVYQKRIASPFVFGLAYGGYQLGNCLGWALGAYGIAAVIGEPHGVAMYVAMLFIVLVCAFVLFSEKEFGDLFKPASDDETSLEELLAADLVHKAREDERIDPKERLAKIVDELSTEFKLSNREREVLQWLAMGYDSSAISKRLQISWNTVRTHTRKVYSKLDVHSKQELIDLVETRLEGSSQLSQGANAE